MSYSLPALPCRFGCISGFFLRIVPQAIAALLQPLVRNKSQLAVAMQCLAAAQPRVVGATQRSTTRGGPRHAWRLPDLQTVARAAGGAARCTLPVHPRSDSSRRHRCRAVPPAAPPLARAAAAPPGGRPRCQPPALQLLQARRPDRDYDVAFDDEEDWEAQVRCRADAGRLLGLPAAPPAVAAAAQPLPTPPPGRPCVQGAPVTAPGLGPILNTALRGLSAISERLADFALQYAPADASPAVVRVAVNAGLVLLALSFVKSLLSVGAAARQRGGRIGRGARPSAAAAVAVAHSRTRRRTRLTCLRPPCPRSSSSL